MAIIGSTYVDLIDVYKQQDPKGTIAPVIEMLTRMNPILEDAIAVECNKGTRHMHSIRTGLPSVTWGMLYKGIPQSKSGYAQVEDTTGFVEGLSTIDERLLAISKNPAQLRLNEAAGFLESLSQEVATRIFYGNTNSDPEQFMGLSPRFNLKSAANGGQIVDAGGTGSDNTSVWFITWGETTAHLLYPEGTKAGVERRDMGLQRVLDSDGNPFYAVEEKFTQHIGLAIKDWRYVVRIANIDVSDMAAGTVLLYKFMAQAYYALWNRRKATGKIVIYANRTVLAYLDQLGVNAGVADNFIRITTAMDVQGKEVKSYRGIPIRETDAIVNTEARVL
jgi:hypothetical protein